MATKLFELWHFKIGADDDYDQDENMRSAQEIFP
jgi:hypothetical protein